MEGKNFKLDFVGIRIPKCGTSWIIQCLKEHPQICFPEGKHLDFFRDEKLYEKGLEWYASFFKHCSLQSIKGEYPKISNPKIPQLLKRNFPDLKVLTCLRNPIERAYSFYFYDKSWKEIPSVEFEEILNNPRYKDIRKNYIEKSLYYSQIKKWLEIFPKEQILILIYEDIKKNPLAFIQKIYSFLGADSKFVPPSANQRINPASQKRMLIPPPIDKFRFEKIKNQIRKNWLGEKAIKMVKFFLNPLTKLLGEKNYIKKVKSSPKPSMRPETRQHLQEIFQEDIESLEKLLNRDLSFWK